LLRETVLRHAKPASHVTPHARVTESPRIAAALEATAASFSVIASCRLHSLHPFQHLEKILRVLPYRPCDLELSPRYSRPTRGRLRADELATPISVFEVPPLLGEAATSFASAGSSP
jgi:hypothetical protein